MPSNFTENYNLSQWERTDQVRMEDFNEDNAKIDAALKAEADARTAADSAINTALSKRGNCQIWTKAYTGTGTYGKDHPTQFTFPEVPFLALVILDSGSIMITLTPGLTNYTYPAGISSIGVDVTWSGKTVKLSCTQAYGQMNQEGQRYFVIAFWRKD